MDPLNYKLKTYGCKVNTYDSGLIDKHLKDSGLSLPEDSDLHILNTCAVTAEATKEALRSVRKIKTQNPKATVVVTGCAAQVDTEKFSDSEFVDLVIANSHKAQMAELIESRLKGRDVQRVYKSNIFKKEDLGRGGGLERKHTRSFLKIQDGCNSFCTFCVIPFARGKSRSISIDENVARVQQIYDSGVRELVITGVHIGDYCDEELGYSRGLEDLVEQVLLRTPMPRVRLSSLEPIEVSPRLLDLYSDARLCPHFHMSIQSAQSKVLRDMKRNYGHREVEEALNEIHRRVPGVYVGMDVIVGFPGETAREHRESLSRLESLPWTRIHVFPYSPRPGVYANRLEGQWDRSVIMGRAQELRELSFARLTDRAKAQIGTVKQALVIGDGHTALSRDYWNLRLDRRATVGEEIDVQVLENREDLSAANLQLEGKVLTVLES